MGPAKDENLWHQNIAYVSKNYIVLLIYSCLIVQYSCKIAMLPRSETFEIHNNVI